MTIRMKYLNNKCKELEDKFNTPERLTRLADGVSKHLSVSFEREIKGLRFKITATKLRSYSYSYECEAGENPQFTVSLVDEKDYSYLTVLGFSLSIYPHCCGMMQLNGFSHCLEYRQLPIINQEEMEELMGQFINIYRTGDDYRLVRIMMNMVEAGRGSQGRNDLKEVKPIENPEILYKGFWTWAHKQTRVRDMLMVNGNSGNILHHMEVILK